MEVIKVSECSKCPFAIYGIYNSSDECGILSFLNQDIQYALPETGVHGLCPLNDIAFLIKKD